MQRNLTWRGSIRYTFELSMCKHGQMLGAIHIYVLVGKVQLSSVFLCFTLSIDLCCCTHLLANHRALRTSGSILLQTFTTLIMVVWTDNSFGTAPPPWPSWLLHDHIFNYFVLCDWKLVSRISPTAMSLLGSQLPSTAYTLWLDTI